MCGKFTQLYSWQDVHAFSQPIGVVNAPAEAEVVVSTPMRIANIMRLNANGERELVPMCWGFAGKDDTNPGPPKHMHARGETVAPLFVQRRVPLLVRWQSLGQTKMAPRQLGANVP